MRKTAITLSLSPGDKEQLERIAIEYGCTWGDRPNISELLKRLAHGKLRVEWGDETQTDSPKSAAIAKHIGAIQEGLSGLIRLM